MMENEQKNKRWHKTEKDRPKGGRQRKGRKVMSPRGWVNEEWTGGGQSGLSREQAKGWEEVKETKGQGEEEWSALGFSWKEMRVRWAEITRAEDVWLSVKQADVPTQWLWSLAFWLFDLFKDSSRAESN